MTRRDIHPHGEYFPLDSEGFIVSVASLQKIVPPWKAVVDAIVRACEKEYSTRLIGVYVRGSVAAGQAVPGFSDIDVFALLQPCDDEQIRWAEAPWARALEDHLRQQYDFVRRIDLSIATFDEDFGTRNPALQMVLKTQSVCVYGTDIIPRIAKRYRPNRDMMLNLQWVRPELDELYRLVDAGPSPDAIARKCSELTKVLIRAGFELVMEREQRYTTSLYYCYESFTRHYPEKASLMKQALYLYLNPTSDQQQLLHLADELGEWLAAVSLK